ncbi:GntR family transcriptional regulator [Thermocrispum sp.]|jgi:GntR family transcriptional regulator|uniref:GntR family transcriptional regulator n=1 Tax=Thermocrispum sp. TaxID=2060768 RepID=UPI0025803D10|nr:GntR family transcriptional regulator [Thermocrispum sp.]
MADEARKGRYGYREIADELRARIDGGELPPGSKVPGENELMAQYGVEQPTARRALDVLKNEGLIIARRGSGTYVREFRPIRRVSPDRLKTSVWGAGRSIWSSDVKDRPVADDVQVTQEEAPAHIAHVLELESGAKVTVRRRKYLVEGRPVQLATSYYPADLVAGSRITEIDTGPGGSYARLKELGHEPVHFREELRARMPRGDEVGALGLSQGTPVIVIARTAYTAENSPVEVNEMILDSGSYVLEYKFSSEAN